MKKKFFCFLIALLCITVVNAQNTHSSLGTLVKTANGSLEGTADSGIHSYKGIPFAQPPIGNLRWKEPQPAANWTGIRKANSFGPRAMQLPLFSDMVFRSNGMSEDCLYLNIWTPAKSADERLPVLVYFYGGGFVGGDGSENRYDGESMSRKGIVAITVNYRLGVFGFLSHPELSKESPHHASGNYGLMDQSAALKWVKQNVAAFGGDPAKITIAGESAGSYSVSAQMASPLSRNLIAGAIGESGSLIGTQPTISLAEAEKVGVKFTDSVGAKSLEALRAMPATDVLAATAKPGNSRFPVSVDGYFFPKSPLQIYTAGEEAHVPLMVGWNSQENSYGSVFGKQNPTQANYTTTLQKLYGDHADEAAKVYAASTDDEVMQAATDLASDRFIGFSTWKWSDLQSKTGGKPVYRYFYSRPRPATKAEAATGASQKTGPQGASHSAEIEYALGNLKTNTTYDWQPEDFKVSELMQNYFANFIKTGNPNGAGLPDWPANNSGSLVQVMHIDVTTQARPETHRDRYLFLDKLAGK